MVVTTGQASAVGRMERSASRAEQGFVTDVTKTRLGRAAMGGPGLGGLSDGVVGRHITRDVDDAVRQRTGQRDGCQCLGHS